MLSAKQVERAKPQGKPHKLADGKGLYLFVTACGNKSWRFDYRFGGKRQTLVLGRFPEISLAEARAKHLNARRSLVNGDDPAQLKRRSKEAAAQTFKAIAEEWFRTTVSKSSKSWQANVRRWLDQAYPYIGNVSIERLAGPDVLAMLRGIEREKHPSAAELVRKAVALVFQYAIQTFRADANPAKNLAGVIQLPRAQPNPHLAVHEIADFLKAVDADDGEPATKLAVRLILLMFCRKNELQRAEKTEFDLDNATWTIPAARMKNGIPHVVPLSRQAIVYLRRLFDLSSESIFVLPKFSDPKKHMGNTTLNVLFTRIGYGEKLTPHGLRATASTALNEMGFRYDVIEAQLSHVEKNDVRRAYNHATYSRERREMMQAWADYIDSLCLPGDVAPIKAAA